MDEEKLTLHTTALIERLGADESDRGKIKGLLEDAIVLILGYTNRQQDELVNDLYYYARQLVVISWNQEGNEGESSRSEGGVSQTFITDIPDKLKSGLNVYRVGKVVSFYASKRT